ncbi:MAG: hypothetical protein PHI05_01420 [Bacilli bacterium]|nr:hypothetical protein [Bacilli bacterium]
MNYIYDVLLNYNNELYECYEWNLNDNIIHIRRIPLIKISSKNLIEMRENQIKISDDLLSQIKGKTEIFSKKKDELYDYASIFSDGLDALGIVFDVEGNSILKSKMLFDEEGEVLEVCDRLPENEIKYSIICKEIIDPFKTRFERIVDKYIKNEIKLIQDIDKLKYLYYECFNETEDDKGKIVKRINNELKYNWDVISKVLYDFFKLTSIQK